MDADGTIYSDESQWEYDPSTNTYRLLLARRGQAGWSSGSALSEERTLALHICTIYSLACPDVYIIDSGTH
ncbi:TPA: hypothetical protein JD342_21635 [Citrobacter freundii]|nr:hypothetical protein [Citrobacter freundii]